MKKILSSFIFSAIVVGGIFFFGILFNPNRLETTGFNINEFKMERQDIDVIFLGSSYMYCSFSPMEAWNESGITSYIAGGPEQSLSITYALFKNTLKYKTPRCVVLELRGLSFESGGMFAELDPAVYIQSPFSWYARLSAAIDGKKIEADPSEPYDFFTYHNMWKKLQEKDFRQTYQILRGKLRPSFFKGYVYLNETRPGIAVHDDVVFELDEAYYNNLIYLEKIVELCAERGIELVFLKTPSANINYFNLYLESVSRLYPGIRMLHLNEYLNEMDFDLLTDMYDGGHPNYSGAVKCTGYITEYLGYLNLRDKRGDPEYEDWHSQYEMYEKIVNPK